MELVLTIKRCAVKLQNKLNQLDETKVETESIIDTINNSTEEKIIETTKFLYVKTITNTTDADGFLNPQINSDYVICSATAQFNDNNYGFVIPYYYYNNGNPIWLLKIEDKSNSAVLNTQITAKIYYFKKERND